MRRQTHHIDELIITRPGIQEEDMGLLDIINGMQNGPRGQRQPKYGGKAAGCRRS